MIDAREVDEWAARFGVGQSQVRRDHFLSHVLAAIGAVAPALRFFGGTALCRTYLEGARLSEDVDLLGEAPRDSLAEMADLVPRALRREFPDAVFGGATAADDGYTATVAVSGLTPLKVYVGRDGVNTRAFEFAPTPVQLRYSDLPTTQEFVCPTLPAFAAMKLSAWFDRHAPRDLFDLAGLAELEVLRSPDTIRMFGRKNGFTAIDGGFGRVPRATADAWSTELAAQTGVLPSSDECLARVRAAIG